jgi:hypothetical protein
LRALAELIMRGRALACGVAVFGSLLPLISPATIGLVTLRKDSSEGLIVALWALLPWLALYLTGSMSPLLTLAPSAALVVIVVAANVLRTTASWQWTLIGVGFCSAVAVSIVGFVASADIDQVVAEVAELVAQISAQAGVSEELSLVPDRTFVLGLLAWMIALTVVCGLLVARWWQALLFNPGGFREEFHGFRLEQRVAVILFAIVVAGVTLPREYTPWIELLSLPLLLAGVALVHSTVKLMGWGGHWLGLMYFGLFFIGPTGTVLVGLGLVDSILNLRSRLAAFKNRDS